jgi:hypothetical protein
VFVRFITDRGSWRNGFINPNFDYFVTSINTEHGGAVGADY